MRETYATWMTPDALDHWAAGLGRTDLREKVLPYLSEYIETAVKPVLAVPETDRERLPGELIRFVLAGNEPRLRILFALYGALGADLEKMLDSTTPIDRVVPEFRSRAVPLFERDYLDSFEMGARVYVRTIGRLVPWVKGQAKNLTIPQGKVETWYEFVHAAGCLDLSATAVLWYLKEDRGAGHAPIAEELCYLVKEYALYHGSCAQTLLFGQEKEREAVSTDPTPEDRRWDQDFCRLTLPGIREHLKAS